MASNIFRIFKPEGSKEDRVQKRRNQLREAQRTYRDRKDQYTKSLEKEIARARANEANLLREVERLRVTTQMLRRLLHQQGFQVSDEVCAKVGTDELHGWNQSDRGGNIEATPKSTFAESTADPEASHHSPFLRDDRETYTGTRDIRINGLDNGIAIHQLGTRMCDLDLVEAGIDFVLILERPCLGHLNENPDEPNEPAGHALTTSAQVLSISPQFPSCFYPVPGTMVCRDVPAAILDSLLNLSSELCSEEEVTPVQAWKHIRCRPQFGGLEARSLYKLAEILRDAVKCHGFGAVIERGIFEKSVSQILLDGRAF